MPSAARHTVAATATRTAVDNGKPAPGLRTRLTVRPYDNGIKKLLAKYGAHLPAVRYRYDLAGQRRLGTVEPIEQGCLGTFHHQTANARRTLPSSSALPLEKRRSGMPSIPLPPPGKKTKSCGCCPPPQPKRSASKYASSNDRSHIDVDIHTSRCSADVYGAPYWCWLYRVV